MICYVRGQLPTVARCRNYIKPIKPIDNKLTWYGSPQKSHQVTLPAVGRYKVQATSYQCGDVWAQIAGVKFSGSNTAITATFSVGSNRQVTVLGATAANETVGRYIDFKFTYLGDLWVGYARGQRLPDIS